MTPLARLAHAAGLALGAPLAHAEEAPFGPQSMRMVLGPSCGCCAAQVGMAREHGHEVEALDVLDVGEAEGAAGVPEAPWSCQTAEIAGRTIEGHVPFEAIDRLLAERPEVGGPAVPGCPWAQPGMGEGPDARGDVIAWGGEAGSGAMAPAVIGPHGSSAWTRPRPPGPPLRTIGIAATGGGRQASG